MDQERWDNILAQVNAPKSDWRLLSRELINTTKAFESGSGARWEEVKKLRETWQSDRPFVDATGRPFVLYIYDQALSYRFSGYYRNSNQQSSYKFHFSWCSTLEAMDTGGRRARYKAKHDVDNNIFSVHRGDQKKDEKIPMLVCRNCLQNMDYEGYSSHYSGRETIYNNFDIAKFFTKHGPQNLKNPTHQNHAGGYTEDWSTISRNLKEKKNYTCEKCGHKKPRSLNVHHKNGVKSDNSPANLVVLCHDCHASEPFHSHMKKTTNFRDAISPIEISKNAPTENFSQSRMNKFENFLLQPERYATGSEKATQKVSDAKDFFESIKYKLPKEKQDQFYSALSRYERELKSSKVA